MQTAVTSPAETATNPALLLPAARERHLALLAAVPSVAPLRRRKQAAWPPVFSSGS